MTDNKIVTYMKSEHVLANFTDVLGHSANAYVSSVLITVANDERLQECTPASIYVAAMKAANAGLSVDAETGRAYLVPYRNGKTGQLEAQFQIGYRGLKQMAMDTNKYRYINCGPIYEGEGVEEDRISGLHKLVGSRTGNKVIGWLAAFELYSGYAKTFYMTVDEIHYHAKKHNPGGYESSKGGWKRYPKGDKTNVMEQKTPLRLLLLRDGYLTPAQAAIVRENEADVLDLEAQPADAWDADIAATEQAEPPIRQSAADTVSELVGEPKSKAVVREANEPGITPQFLVNEQVVDNTVHAEALMNLLGIPSGAPADAGMERIKLYNSWRKIYAKKTAQDRELAAEKAIAGEVPA
jgi:recombination protein RecT